MKWAHAGRPPKRREIGPCDRLHGDSRVARCAQRAHAAHGGRFAGGLRVCARIAPPRCGAPEPYALRLARRGGAFEAGPIDGTIGRRRRFPSDKRLTRPWIVGHRVRVPPRRGGRRRAARLHRAGRRDSNSCRRRVCRVCATARREERIHVETRSRQSSSARSVQPPQVRPGGARRHVRRGGAARVRADDHHRCRRPRRRHRPDPLGRRERARLSRAAGRQEQSAGDRRDPRGVRRACAHRRHLPALREARLSGDRAGSVCAAGRSVEACVDPRTDRSGGQQGARPSGDRGSRRDGAMGGQERRGPVAARRDGFLLGRPADVAFRRAQSARARRCRVVRQGGRRDERDDAVQS